MIGFQSVVTKSEEDIKYSLEVVLEGATLSEASLLLASLHVIEKRIIDYLEDIKPDLEMEK